MHNNNEEVANIYRHSSCAKHCSKFFTCINSLNLLSQMPFFALFRGEEAKPERCMSRGCKGHGCNLHSHGLRQHRGITTILHHDFT